MTRPPIPPGTRDILADEMRELRALEDALRDAFERHGYGEVATPTIEYHEVLARGDDRGAPSAYRFFDESGELLALRSDMTVPIARLAASRFGGEEPPFRFSYVGSAFRAVRPQRGQAREFRQAGVELGPDLWDQGQQYPGEPHAGRLHRRASRSSKKRG